MEKKKVLAFGTFDLVHEGHRYYLEQAKKLGSKLIVVVARDAMVQKVKGAKPLHSEKKRLKTVQKLGIADDVILGNSPLVSSKYKTVAEIQPDVIALGYDQEIDLKLLKEELKKVKWEGEIERITSFKEDVYKSSKLKSSEK